MNDQMTETYHYQVNGIDANGQSWSTGGAIACGFFEVFDIVMRESFHKLTKGQAIYGSPGRGCAGPYRIERVLIELVNDSPAI